MATVYKALMKWSFQCSPRTKTVAKKLHLTFKSEENEANPENRVHKQTRREQSSEGHSTDKLRDHIFNAKTTGIHSPLSLPKNIAAACTGHYEGKIIKLASTNLIQVSTTSITSGFANHTGSAEDLLETGSSVHQDDSSTEASNTKMGRASQEPQGKGDSNVEVKEWADSNLESPEVPTSAVSGFTDHHDSALDSLDTGSSVDQDDSSAAWVHPGEERQEGASLPPPENPCSQASSTTTAQGSQELQAMGNKAPKKLITPASQCGDEVIPKVIGHEVMGDKDKDSVEQSSRRAAVERLVEAGERLKRTLAEPQDVPFHSTVKTYLQALLGMMTGDAMEDFQKLQDDSQDEIRYRKSKVAAAFKEALKHVETSSHIGEAVKLLPKVKKKLLNLFERDRQSAKVIGNLLQVISEKLQKPETEKKKDSQAYGWRLDEDACLDLVSRLQKTVELLEDWENPSREEVTQMDEDDLNCSENLSQHPELPRVNGVKFHNSPGRVGKGVITSLTPKLLSLLLLAYLLKGAAASPLSASIRVQGSGRAEQGQAYSLTCEVEGLPGTDTTSSYIWYKDGDVIREETKQALTFTRLTQGDAGNYQCGPKRPPRLGILLSQPFQIREFGGHKVIPRPSLGSMSLPVLQQPFELLCIVFGLTQNHDIHLTYTWLKDSREIPGQTSKSLVFPSLTREDEGIYMCRAKSGHVLTTSPNSNEKDLRILMPPSVHMEPATPNNVIRRAAGEELTLTCKVTEAFPWVPANGYSWSYLPSLHGPLRPLVGRESILRLGPLTREDSGQYFCQARNDLEVFQGQIPPGNTSVAVNVIYLGNITLTPDLKVNEGEYVTLTCSVESNPPAHLAWIVDGQEGRHVTANTDHYVLQRTACSDSKTYTCRASNADLPDLERHASTNVRVTCNNSVADPPSPPPSPSSSTQDNAVEPDPSQQSWLWGLVAVLAVALVVALGVVVYCGCRTPRKQRERDREDAATETRLLENSAETASSSDSGVLVAAAKT